MTKINLTLFILLFGWNSYAGFCTTEQAQVAAIKAYNSKYNASLPTDGSYEYVSATFISTTKMGDASLKLFQVVLNVNGGSGTWAITLDGNNSCKSLTEVVVQTD